MKTIGVTNFLSKSFNVFPFEGEWLESFGEPEKNFTMVLYGDPGNGKTATKNNINNLLYLITFKVKYNAKTT